MALLHWHQPVVALPPLWTTLCLSITLPNPSLLRLLLRVWSRGPNPLPLVLTGILGGVGTCLQPRARVFGPHYRPRHTLHLLPPHTPPPPRPRSRGQPMPLILSLDESWTSSRLNTAPSLISLSLLSVNASSNVMSSLLFTYYVCIITRTNTTHFWRANTRAVRNESSVCLPNHCIVGYSIKAKSNELSF